MESIKSLLKRSALLSSLNAYTKAVTQEARARHITTRYRRKAHELGIAIPSQHALKEALRKRLHDRARARGWPRHLGDLHLFVVFALCNWESVLPRALSVFGEISVFEWRSHGFDDTARDWLSRRDAMNKAMLAAFHEANRHRPVDAVVSYVSGYTVSPSTLAAMANSGAAIFNFSFDDKLNFPGRVIGGRWESPAALAGVVDLNLTSDPESIIKYMVHGGLAMFHPEAADPNIHNPQHVSFKYDVSFIGANYGWRPRFIRTLGKFGIKVECFGPGWPNGEVGLEQMARIYSCSRINLGFAGIGHSRRLMCLKGRDFEVPMSGGLYLTQDNPELRFVYDVGREIVTYKDEWDCAQQIQCLLRDEERAAAIRRAGLERARRDHTYEARWSRVFTLAGLLQESGVFQSSHAEHKGDVVA